MDSNYHTQNGKLFAEAVGVCTGGDLEIVVHGGGTLFKGGEIKRAVQTGRAPIGERLLSARQNENAVFGFDSVPFLASSFEASLRCVTPRGPGNGRGPPSHAGGTSPGQGA